MSTRVFAIILTVGLALAAGLLALGAARDLPGLEYAGAGTVLVVLLARLLWSESDR